MVPHVCYSDLHGGSRDAENTFMGTVTVSVVEGRETYITTYQVPREIVRLPLIQEGLTHLRTCARVSVTALHRLNRPSSRCGSSLRNFTASTSTRRTTRILLCRLGKLAAMPGMGRKGRERHGGQSRPNAGFHLGGKGGMEPRREAGGRDGEAQVSEK